jgi:hypothetical protein
VARISNGFSWSNSSWIWPTNSSRMFSSNHPTVLPYSSTTMARCNFRSEQHLEHFFEVSGFGDVNQLAGNGQEFRGGPRLEPHRIEVLNVNHPKSLIQIAGLT